MSECARYRVYCLPSAGAGVAPFYRWRRLVEEHVEIEPLCPPGRETRHRESLMTSFMDLVDDFSKIIKAHDNERGKQPFVILGHSMGGLLGYELARQLTQAGRAPRLLFVAAIRAPHYGPNKPPLHGLSDEELKSQLVTRYGDPAGVFQREDATRLFLPIVRADLQAVETFTSEHLEPLPCPIVALGGLADRSVPREKLEEWGPYTNDSFTCDQVDGGHFFVHEYRREILKRICEQMDKSNEAASQSIRKRNQ